MATQVAHTLSLSDIDAGAATTPGYWTSWGEDVSLEGVVWRGTGGVNGALFDVGEVVQTIDLPGARTTVTLATPTVAQRAILTNAAVGLIEAEVGWIYRLSPDSPWTRVRRRHSGAVSELKIKDGLSTFQIETELGDVSRGRPLYWSDAAQRGTDRGGAADDAFAQAAELAGDHEIRWPPSR